MTIYDFTLTDGKGNEVPLANYKGKVMLIVNTATGCGFTPHYKPIEQMYSDFHDKGFEVIDIPCNQFNGQTPGTDDEIHEFCTLHYGTEFPQMKKSDVNGPFEGFGFGVKAAAMALFIKSIDKDYKNNPNIKWNFTKFVIDRAGNVVARFEPTAKMEDVRSCVEKLL